jgi:hypothetical protein
MPQAKRSSSTSRSRTSFKPPAALKRLSTSLDTAHQALTELRKGSTREVGKGSSDLYADLRTFVSNARRDSNKLAKALQKEFDAAQKQLAKATPSARGGSRASTRKSSSRATTSRTSSARSAASRASSGASSAKRSTSKRSASASGSTRRATTKRSASSS